jgi:hypothetical protein
VCTHRCKQVNNARHAGRAQWRSVTVGPTVNRIEKPRSENDQRLAVARVRKSRIRAYGSSVRNNIIDCEPSSASAEAGWRDLFTEIWQRQAPMLQRRRCYMRYDEWATHQAVEHAKNHHYRYERKRHRFPPVSLHGCWGRRRRYVLFGAGRPGIPTVSSYSRRVFS